MDMYCLECKSADFDVPERMVKIAICPHCGSMNIKPNNRKDDKKSAHKNKAPKRRYDNQ